MKRNFRRLLLVMTAMSMAACSDVFISANTADDEKSALLLRASDIKAAAAAAGYLSEDQRVALDDLVRDIAAWQARTGRTDLAVNAPQPAIDDTAPLVPAGVAPSDPSCTPCPAVKAEGGKICFLVGGTKCPRPEDFITIKCWYTCIIDLGPPAPIKSR